MNKELTLSEIKSITTSMLEYVDKVCKERDITYYLAAGTLLGAVRHKGFIPWDDDVDIMIPRNDYERLTREFPDNDNYSFLTLHNTENFPFAYGKIIDRRTVKIEPLRKKYQHTGIDIDVFPIDYYPDNIEEAKKWCESISNCQTSIVSISSSYSKSDNFISSAVHYCYYIIKCVLDGVGLRTASKKVKKINELSQKYNSDQSHYCGIAAVSAYGIRKRNRCDVFKEAVEVEFEGHMYPAPIGFDEYLSDYYGNYMELPPIEKRATHHTYKAYWKE